MLEAELRAQVEKYQDEVLTYPDKVYNLLILISHY